MFYLDLYHGRATPTESLDDWGTQGPILGPLTGIQVTYGSSVRLFLTEGHDEIWLTIEPGGCIYYDGRYYGDFSLSQVLAADEVAVLPTLSAATLVEPATADPLPDRPEGTPRTRSELAQLLDDAAGIFAGNAIAPTRLINQLTWLAMKFRRPRRRRTRG
jgi:hypothetical protein